MTELIAYLCVTIVWGQVMYGLIQAFFYWKDKSAKINQHDLALNHIFDRLDKLEAKGAKK